MKIGAAAVPLTIFLSAVCSVFGQAASDTSQAAIISELRSRALAEVTVRFQ